MSHASAANTELRELIAALCNGTASAEQRDRLELLLTDDQEAQLAYLAFADVHANMLWQHRGRCDEILALAAETSGQWPVASDCRVQSPESRVESCTDIPEIPIINLQISKFPNLQIPTLNSRLSTLNSWTFSYSVATLFLAIFLLGAWSYTIVHPRADSLVVKKSSDATPSVAHEKKPSQFTFVGRVSGMVDCQWADEATATSPGAAVALNRRYALKSGLMEITYDSGAKVILQGPCDYTVESPRSGFLKVGKLVARVGAGGGGRGAGETKNLPSPFGRGAGGEGLGPHSQSALTLTLSQRERGQNIHPTPHAPHPAPLFSVRTPTATVEDLGTEFGVEVSDNGETASHVFQGQVRVRVEGAGNENPQSPNPRIPNPELVLSAGQSARVALDGNRSPRIIREENKAVSAAFVQRMPRRAPFALFNTGFGLKEGDEDPRWQIVARSDQPDFKPRAAVVTRPAPYVWLANSDQSRWISTAADAPPLANGITFTFRTTFELVDAIPSTAVLQGQFIADNHVRAIRLNGKELRVAEHGELMPYDKFVRFTAQGGFVKGTNILEIDVYNGVEIEPESTEKSPMGLRVELSGSVMRVQDGKGVRDAGKEGDAKN
jgi:hypothetical protein